MARENQAMQQITEFRQGNKNDKQTRTPYTFLLIVGSILVIYSLTFFYISNRIGLLSALEDVVFSTSDAHGYRLYADFIAGKSNVPNPALFDIRPFLFPLYLSVYHLIGIKGFIIIQWMLVITTIVMTYLTIRNITGSGWWGILGVLLIIMNPTFSFISLHALTETLALALLSLAVYQIISYFRVGKKRHLFLSFFFLSLLVCTKPVYLPFLLLWILYAGYRLLRLRRALLRAAILVPLALSPLAGQMMLNHALTGNGGISTAGSANFEDRFFPVVHGFANGEGFVTYRTPEAKAAKNQYPELKEKIAFVLTHPYAYVKATGFLLKHNLMAASIFTRIPERLIKDAQLSRTLSKMSRNINKTMVWVHILGFLSILVLVLKGDPDSHLLIMMACLVYGLLAFSALAYWQGDRLIMAALPPWAVLYGWIAGKIFGSGYFMRFKRRLNVCFRMKNTL